MRIIIIYFFNILLPLVSLGQAVFNQFDQYDSDLDTLHSGAIPVQQTQDGGFIFGGREYNAFIGNSHMFVIKTDCKGDTNWKKEYDLTSEGETCYSIIETSNGYILTGGIRDTVNSNSNAYLMKIDYSGNILWLKQYGIEQGYDIAWDVVQTPDGGFAFAGYQGTTDSVGNNSPEDCFLMKTDSAGNLLWSRSYGNSGSDACYHLELTNDGGFLLSGVTSSFNAVILDLYVIKTDAEGNLLWQKNYSSSFNAGSSGSVAKQTLDGGYILIGDKNDSMSRDYTWILKLDTSGTIQWDKIYQDKAINGGPNGILVLPDSNYVFFGTRYINSSLDYDGWLVKIDKNGDSLWGKTYGGPLNRDDYFYDAQLTSDGGFVMAGQYQLGGLLTDSDAWLVKVDSNGCVDSTCNLDCIACDFILPAAFADTDTVYLTQNTPIQFYDSSAIANIWKWDFGEGVISNEKNPQHVFKSAGTFAVKLFASFGSCTDADTVNVKVIDDCQHNITTISTPDTVYLLDSTVQFSGNNVLATQWQWDFGDDNTDTVQNPVHAYDSTGKFTTKLIAFYGNCSDTATKTLTIIYDCINYQTTITVQDTAYLDSAIQFSTNNSLVTKWLWHFGDGNTDTVQNPVHGFDSIGEFTVTLIALYGNCSDTATKTITVIYNCNNYQTTITAKDSVYLDSAIQFSTNNTLTTKWQWNFGDGTTDTVQNPVYAYDSIGEFTVTLIAFYGNCSDTAVKTITVIYDCINYQTTITAEDSVYLDSTIQFSTNNTLITKWQWNFGDGTTDTVQNPVYAYDSIGEFTVTLIAFYGNCSDTATKILTIIYNCNNYQTSISAPDSVYLDSATQFSSINNLATQWQWNFGDGITDTLQNPVHAFDSIGEFTVTLIAFYGNCSDTVTKTTAVIYNCDIYQTTISAPDTVYLDSLIKFSAINALATQWQWNFGDGSTDTTPNPTHTYSDYGTYEICLIALNICGADTLCKSISIIEGIKENTGKINLKIFPNPNSGTFTIIIDQSTASEIQITLTNILGQKIYTNKVTAKIFKDEINLTNFSKGLYSFKMVTNNESISRKVVYR